MRSRGIWWYMSARTRKSLTLFWTALFVCSLLMQYANFTAAPPVAAVHDEGIFELDGNAVDEATAGDDWQNGTPGALDTLFVPGSVEKDGADTTYFKGGGSKDHHDISDWAWSATDVAPDKDELLDVFAAVYEDPDGTIVYFGADKFDDSGDAQIGFWFFQDQISLNADGSFNGLHTVGDVLVLSDFTNGGNVDLICVYEWNPPGDDTTLDDDMGCDIGNNVTLVAAGAECDVSSDDGEFDVCAIVNAGTETAPWAFVNKDGATSFGAGQFFEGGINLDLLFGGDAPCFSGFLAETRSSQEVEAQLKDFALGTLNTCRPPDIETQVSDSVITIGESVTDSADLTSNDPDPTGSIEFWVCGPDDTAPDCSTGGTLVSTETLVAGVATSDPFTPDAVGFYCFRAEYSPDAAGELNYVAGSHTNLTSECFEVVKAQPSIVTFEDETVSAGEAISDSATLSGGTDDISGTITFEAFGPDDDDCSGDPAFTETVDVDGNGDYGPVSFTPDTAGTYHWIASYSGDDKNEPAAGACGDDGENDTVDQVQPEISTSADETVDVGKEISDTAHLSGGTNPTGTITFWAFGPDDADCSGEPVFTDEVAVNGNGDYGPVSFTPDTAGTYRWIASYSGDANNLPAEGACNDEGETDEVEPLSPTITTLLVADEVEGVNLTLPIGSTVHDTATLSGATADASGTVTYTVYTDNACTNEFADAGTADVTNGVVGDSDSVTFNAAGTYYWQAEYSGDVNNESAISDCTSEIVTIVPNEVVINTELSGQGQTGQHITIQIGNSVTDSATLTGETADAGGTVTYTVYSDNACTLLFADGGTVDVTNGVVPDSDPVLFDIEGTFYWQAEYSGDANNEAAISACADESVTVIVPEIDLDKSHNDADGIVSAGQTVTFTLEVSVFNGPVTDAVVTDVLPVGQTYVAGSQSSNPAETSFEVSADGRTLTWTYDSLDDSGAVITYDITIDEDAPIGDLVNEAQVCVSEVEGCEGDDELVTVPDLTIVKSFTGNTGGELGGIPQAEIGDTLTYTLTYDLTNGPVHNGVITDTLPVGLAYITGSATNNAEFTFVDYDAATRTLTWTAPLVSADGSVTYQVTVLAAAADEPQPLVNVATIDSDETPRDDDERRVLVAPPPLVLTPPPTLPPTDAIAEPSQGASNPGTSLMLVLLGLAGIALALGFVTPVPERVRRRDGR